MPIFGAKSRAARGCASKLACGRRIDPTECNCKIVRIFGENAKGSVGADDPVRPLGNGKFAAAFRKNGRAPYGSMWASTPTNIVRGHRWCVRVCRCVPPGGQRRPPLRVRTVSHWCIQFCNAVLRGRGRTPPLRLDWRCAVNKKRPRCVCTAGFLILSSTGSCNGCGCGE